MVLVSLTCAEKYVHSIENECILGCSMLDFMAKLFFPVPALFMLIPRRSSPVPKTSNVS